MDEKVIDAFKNSYSKSMRSAKIQLLAAVLIVFSAGLSFLDNRTLPGVFQCLAAFGFLFAAHKAREAANHLKPFIDASTKQ